MKPTSRQGRNKQATLKSSPTYQVGKSIAFSTACQKGHIGFSPSISDRADYGDDWRAFMAGWRDGLRDYSKL